MSTFINAQAMIPFQIEKMKVRPKNVDILLNGTQLILVLVSTKDFLISTDSLEFLGDPDSNLDG